MTKRLLDVLLAGIGLVVLSPLLVAIALAVRLESSGPALFRQERVGRGGRSFTILKFRSLRHVATPTATELQITPSDDPRITRVGSVLRRTKLDELPQLINVLAGDMSLVGPRPEVPRYVALYPPDVRQEILSIRPGITDEASIEFRDESNILSASDDPERVYLEQILPAKIEYYRRYVRQRSFLGDLRILSRTMLRVLKLG